MTNMNGLQERKRTYEAAKKALAIANRLGQPYKSRAMSLLNKHRADYLRHVRGKRAERWTPDFYMHVDGIPCGVVITDYCTEPQWRNFEYILVNARGYRMKWLEPRASDSKVMDAWHEAQRLERMP